MSVAGTEIDRLESEDFAENACPTAEGIVESLSILRKKRVPFAADALVSRLDLLFLPFLRGVPTTGKRVERLAAALNLVADRLPRDQEIAYRHVFLAPVHEGVDQRRSAALEELQAHKPLKERQTPGTVKGIEGRMLPAVANILLDPEFACELDEKLPMSTRAPTNRRPGASEAFRTLSHSLAIEIDDDDHRITRLHRLIHLEILLPDQLVVPVRYHARASNPMPVDGSMTMLSKGHTYLGTLPDTQTGSVADWMVHFIYLGTSKDPGDLVTIEMSHEIFDEECNDDNPCVTATVTRGADSTCVAMRLPKRKWPGAAAEVRITRNAHSEGVIIERTPLPIAKDGWVRAEFTKIEVGLQYGIFFPGLELYK